MPGCKTNNLYDKEGGITVAQLEPVFCPYCGAEMNLKQRGRCTPMAWYMCPKCDSCSPVKKFVADAHKAA